LLFGSCRQKRRFVLDTAFVVGNDHFDHERDDYERVLRGAASETYWTVTVEPWYRGDVPQKQSHRLYFGATPERPLQGMFSFFPCRRYDADKSDFARPEIKIPGFITPTLIQGKKIARDFAMNEVAEPGEMWCGRFGGRTSRSASTRSFRPSGRKGGALTAGRRDSA
jgi:hypothetical protein